MLELWIFEKDVHLLRLDDVFLDNIVGGMIIMNCFITLLFVIDKIYLLVILLWDGSF